MRDFNAAVALIHTQYSGELRAALARRLRCAIEAEDVYAEFALKLVEALPRFRGESSVRTWCFVVALNACRRHGARRARYLRTHTELSEQLLPRATTTEPTAEARPSAELEHELRCWLARCPEEPRRVVEARLRGTAYSALARATNPGSRTTTRRAAFEEARLRKVYQRTVSRFRAQRNGSHRDGS